MECGFVSSRFMPITILNFPAFLRYYQSRGTISIYRLSSSYLSLLISHSLSLFGLFYKLPFG